MEISYDAEKDAANIAKHGVSLAEANHIEWHTLWAKSDNRRDYGEIRMVGYAYIDLRLFCVVYTDRGNERRIISLRKANDREVDNYAKT